eukprot:1369107-Pleurochrysis_carterae.AAC.1
MFQKYNSILRASHPAASHGLKEQSQKLCRGNTCAPQPPKRSETSPALPSQPLLSSYAHTQLQPIHLLYTRLTKERCFSPFRENFVFFDVAQILQA